MHKNRFSITGPRGWLMLEVHWNTTSNNTNGLHGLRLTFAGDDFGFGFMGGKKDISMRISIDGSDFGLLTCC